MTTTLNETNPPKNRTIGQIVCLWPRQLVDTSVGLGGIAYQFFSAGMLVDLLERNRFEVFRLELHLEQRVQGTVDWLFALASAERSPEPEPETGLGLGSGDSFGAAGTAARIGDNQAPDQMVGLEGCACDQAAPQGVPRGRCSCSQES